MGREGAGSGHFLRRSSRAQRSADPGTTRLQSRSRDVWRRGADCLGPAASHLVIPTKMGNQYPRRLISFAGRTGLRSCCFAPNRDDIMEGYARLTERRYGRRAAARMAAAAHTLHCQGELPAVYPRKGAADPACRGQGCRISGRRREGPSLRRAGRPVAVMSP